MKVIIDRLLTKFGFMRVSDHYKEITKRIAYENLLAKTAKEAGACVLMDGESLLNSTVEEVAIVHGKWVSVRGCLVTGLVEVGPDAAPFHMDSNVFNGDLGENLLTEIKPILTFDLHQANPDGGY